MFCTRGDRLCKSRVLSDSMSLRRSRCLHTVPFREGQKDNGDRLEKTPYSCTGCSVADGAVLRPKSQRAVLRGVLTGGCGDGSQHGCTCGSETWLGESCPRTLAGGRPRPLWNSLMLQKPRPQVKLSFLAKARTYSLSAQTPGKPERLQSPLELIRNDCFPVHTKVFLYVIMALLAEKPIFGTASPERLRHPRHVLLLRVTAARLLGLCPPTCLPVTN